MHRFVHRRGPFPVRCRRSVRQRRRGGVVIKGLVRPCRHRLGQELQERWQAHLCGLCLTLRDEAGQAARVLTGYDAAAAVGARRGPGRHAADVDGRPLPAARHAHRRGGPRRPARDAARRRRLAAHRRSRAPGQARRRRPARRLPHRRQGGRSTVRTAGRGAGAGRVRLDPATVLGAPAAAHAVETRVAPSLDDLLAPTGAVVSALFAHTADRRRPAGQRRQPLARDRRRLRPAGPPARRGRRPRGRRSATAASTR